MPSSPKTYLKRIGVWSHVKGTADRYQSGVAHPHGQDVTKTPTGERAQETWPDPSPETKGLETTDIPV